MQKNSIVWWELASHDADKSVEFFRKVFEWEMPFDEKLGFYEEELPEEDRKMSGGGIFTLRKAKLPFVTLYIRVDDIDEKVKQIEEAGGFIVIEPFSPSGGSRICLFNEPSGVTFAMIEPKRDS